MTKQQVLERCVYFCSCEVRGSCFVSCSHCSQKCYRIPMTSAFLADLTKSTLMVPSSVLMILMLGLMLLVFAEFLGLQVDLN